MSKKSVVPDAWDDDWEVAADVSLLPGLKGNDPEVLPSPPEPKHRPATA